MKYIILVLLLTVVSLTGCATQSPTPMPLLVPTPTMLNNAVEETQVKSMVENFGKHLAMVSLQSPLAPQDIENQYSEFVSPALLQTWINNPSQAPGRVVSSPWPDRIEINSLAKTDSDKYVVTGSVIQVTSVEIVNGGAAAKTPVRIVVQKIQGHWTITEYAETR
ncbi:MAG: hypothetical protein HZB51_30530 [Chloroflexi bacterium]|nr:hypothetical protein [Chloroflexota bacterium]